MVLPGGGGGGLGPGPVIVTPDPGLLEADPGVMTAAASTFNSAAHQVYSVATATADAAGKLAAGWTGKGVQGFKAASSDTNWYSSSAADGLIGASLALSALARSITAAQALARTAMTLAEQTTQGSAALDTAYANSQARAVSALPSTATSAQVAQAMAPTAGQVSDADMLSLDATRAVTMMNEANTQARTAWRAAASAFDAVTAQSPSVQLAALGVRVKNMSSSMDSAAVDAILLMTAGAAYGAIPAGAYDEDDEVSPAILAEEQADPALAADIEDDAKLTVDGVPMDAAVAADIEGGGTVGWTDAEIAALTATTDDPVAADLITRLAGTTDDPDRLARMIDPALGSDPAQGGSFSQSEYQTAMRIELERGVVLTRATEQSGVDWVDENGTTYDAVGNFPSRFFDQQWPNLQRRIMDHMIYSEYVPVDVSQFTAEQIAQVQRFIGPLGPQVFLVGN
jgi:uncharacterized protein YukE